MNGKILLDTNIIIALLRGEGEIRQTLEEAEDVFVPVIALGELYYGAKKSSRATVNIELLDDFVRSNVILDCDENTARFYGDVKNYLRSKGRPIPENDIWIAAICLQHDLTLFTRDEHFKEIAMLKQK